MSDRYKRQNAMEKIEGYFLPRPHEVKDKQLFAFLRAKDEVIGAYQQMLRDVEGINYTQFLELRNKSIH